MSGEPAISPRCEPGRHEAASEDPDLCQAEPGSQANTGPLTGRTVVVTRSREQASDLSRRLIALGAAVIEIPTIGIVPPASWEPLDAALASLADYQWLIVTSANTARVMRERLDQCHVHYARQPRTVAVGPATAVALEAAGFRVDLVPQPAVAESIVAAIEDQVAGQRVLLVRAAVARDVIPEALGRAGAMVTIVDAYQTVLAEASAALVARIFSAAASDQQPPGKPPLTYPSEPVTASPASSFALSGARTIDAVTFTSSSTARNFLALLEMARLPWPNNLKVFSIGPVTSSTLRELGVSPDSEAANHDVPGLVEEIVRGLSASSCR